MASLSSLPLTFEQLEALHQSGVRRSREGVGLMQVTVTDLHILYGQRQHPRLNPLALAISEATGQAYRVSPSSPSTPGSPLMAYRWAGSRDQGALGLVDRHILPDACSAFYDDYEVYRPVRPFTFAWPEVEGLEARP